MNLTWEAFVNNCQTADCYLMQLFVADSKVCYVECTLCAGAKSGTSSDLPVIDDIHNALMNFIRDQPCTWAPILSSVSHFVMTLVL